MAQHQAAIYRNEIVSPISRFYTFLATNARIVASAIEIPPPGGWPEDYRGVWRSMGKSDEVLDVLSHLPYIDGTAWLWDHETKPINYVDEQILRRLNGDYAKCRYLFEPDQHGDGIGEHVVSLTNGRLYGVWLLLDIQAGTITEFSVLGGLRPQTAEEEEVRRGGWRCWPTKPVGVYFADRQEKMCKVSTVRRPDGY